MENPINETTTVAEMLRRPAVSADPQVIGAASAEPQVVGALHFAWQWVRSASGVRST